MPVLPVSGVRLQLRDATGEEQLLVLTAAGSGAETVVALLERLAHAPGAEAIEWYKLPAVELAVAALLLRRSWLGERIHTETVCPDSECGEIIDVSFFVSDYLEHHRPRPRRGVRSLEDGWFGLDGETVAFRIPTIADLLAAEREERDGDWLSTRCVRPHDASGRQRARVERALAAIAPRMDDHLSGRCPACGKTVELFFAPVEYVLAELHDASAELFADVHELALAYHWSEQSILALDRRRRQSYVGMLRGEVALT